MSSPSPSPSPSGSGHGRSPPPPQARRIVVANRLPLRAVPNPHAPQGFDFSLDPKSLTLHLSRGLPNPVIFLGALPAAAAAAAIPESEDLAADLLLRFSCIPVFPSTNSHFADRLLEVLDPAKDLVIILDHQLWAVPAILRHRFPRARIGFFLHSPLPSSDLFRAMPVGEREEVLRSLLNSDLVGFNTFEYARHFAASCATLLGVHDRTSRGNIVLDYNGRTVVLKVLSVGVEVDQMRAVLLSPETAAKAREIGNEYQNRQLMLAVEGLELKLLAMEKLLGWRPDLRGNVVLLHISDNPQRSPEVLTILNRINSTFGLPGYDPVVMIHSAISMYQKLAFYTSADICIVNAVLDGMNRTPYFYTVCRQEGPLTNCLPGQPRQSCIILSDFVGCSASLSGAIRVNPWSVHGVAEAMDCALRMNEVERQMRQEKYYNYVGTQDAADWLRSFDQDLQRASKNHPSMVNLNVGGLPLSFRVVALGPDFQKLLPEHIYPAYREAAKRIILLDYDGTVTWQEVINKSPSQELIRVLKELCSDHKNTVFLFSGRRKDQLAQWFAPCERLGIFAEHGYFTRWGRDSPWVSSNLVTDFSWMDIALSVMQLYTELTHKSSTEVRETSLVWHYEEAEPDFGLCQAQNLLDTLKSMLANEPVCVRAGHKIVEILPQGVGKGVAMGNLFSAMDDHGNFPDLFLFVGNDWSDEEICEATTTFMKNYTLTEHVKMPHYKLVRVIYKNLQRLQAISRDGETAYAVGIRLRNLAAGLTALNSQLTGGLEYVNNLMPYLELFAGVVEDSGPMGLLVQSSVAMLQNTCKMIKKTTIGLEIGARTFSHVGVHLQGRHPRAQTGGVPSIKDKQVIVRNLEEAKALIDVYQEDGQVFEVDVPQDMAAEEARQMYHLFLDQGAYDLIIASEVLLEKIRTDSDDVDWVFG